jgi:hypothetical protein
MVTANIAATGNDQFCVRRSGASGAELVELPDLRGRNVSHNVRLPRDGEYDLGIFQLDACLADGNGISELRHSGEHRADYEQLGWVAGVSGLSPVWGGGSGGREWPSFLLHDRSLSESPDVEGSRKFTGKERAAETGLDFFGARYFSWAQGKFTSSDWWAKPTPVPFADLVKGSDVNTLLPSAEHAIGSSATESDAPGVPVILPNGSSVPDPHS